MPFRGSGALTMSVPVSEIAVFARAGAIVPTYPDGVQTLTKEFSSVPGAAAVGDNRIVYAFSGANGAFTEAPDAGGLTYVLTSAAGAPTQGDVAATWNGVALAPCDSMAQAPCFMAEADRVVAYGIGPGVLDVSRGGASVATLDAEGGSATRALTLVVRM